MGVLRISLMRVFHHSLSCGCQYYIFSSLGEVSSAVRGYYDQFLRRAGLIFVALTVKTKEARKVIQQCEIVSALLQRCYVFKYNSLKITDLRNVFSHVTT